MKTTLKIISVLALSALGMSAHAGFVQIGGTEPCSNDSCFGGVYTLESSLLSSTSTTETHQITYTLDLSAYDGSQPYVGRLAYHVTSASSYVSSSYVSGPTSGDWDQTTGNISQCEDSRSGGWVCLDWIDGANLLTSTDTIYSWVSTITVLTDGLIDTWSIQADFDPHNGMLLSESAAVPLPGALVLFLTGLGLFGVGSANRRRKA